MKAAASAIYAIRQGAHGVAMAMFERRSDVADPFRMQCRRVFGNRIRNRREDRQRAIVDVNQFDQNGR
jgi:hypothetical protein